MLKTYRVRIVEKIHTDGIMAVEVLVSAENPEGAALRAGHICSGKGIGSTWVETVVEIEEVDEL